MTRTRDVKDRDEGDDAIDDDDVNGESCNQCDEEEREELPRAEYDDFVATASACALDAYCFSACMRACMLRRWERGTWPSGRKGWGMGRWHLPLICESKPRFCPCPYFTSPERWMRLRLTLAIEMAMRLGSCRSTMILWRMVMRALFVDDY